MSRRNDLGVLLVAALASACSFAAAQTIADYSRAQRLALENAMIQAAARSAGQGPQAPGVAASAAPPQPSSSLPLPHANAGVPPAPPPAVQVSGTFATGRRSVAEVMVNATAYLLQAGQGVPGTPWHVESVGPDRVVLSRQAGASPGATADGTEAVRRVFALPALR